MAYNKAPTNWFAGYTATSATNSISFNTGGHPTPALRTFPELTNDEASTGITGDYRKIVYAIMESLFVKYQATVVADRPKNLSIFRGASVSNANTIDFTYSVTIKCNTSGLEVADEPAPPTP